MLGRGRGVDLAHGRPERAVEIGRAEERDHVLLEDPLAVAVRQVGRLEAGRRVELDLAVLQGRVDVEEDRQAVIEALPPDAPLVDQRPGAHLGLVLGHPEVDELAVDDDLGGRPRLDGVDRPLRVDDGRRREDARVVVDRPVDLRLGERRPGPELRPGRLGGLAGWDPVERGVDDLGQGRQQRVVEVAVGQQRQHRGLVDRLALVVREIRRREPGAGVELDLAVALGGVEIEQDDQPVVEADPPHAPLVHQRLRVRFGLVGREVVAIEPLRVDDDLGLRLRLDGIDDRLGLRPGRRGE